MPGSWEGVSGTCNNMALSRGMKILGVILYSIVRGIIYMVSYFTIKLMFQMCRDIGMLHLIRGILGKVLIADRCSRDLSNDRGAWARLGVMRDGFFFKFELGV